MRRLWLAVAVAATTVACFDFDGAYAGFCARAGCDGGMSGGGSSGGSAAGGSAGGSTAGGSTAGGSTAGGSTAGGSTAGGSTAGGSTAGGSMAGGSAGGSTAGGMAFDAGLMCTQPFCVFRHSVRTDVTGADAVIGGAIDDAAAIFSNYTARTSLWVTHGGTTPARGTGTARAFASMALGLRPPFDAVDGTPFDSLIIAEADMTIARLMRIVDGGAPFVVYSGSNCTAGNDVSVSAYDRRGDVVVVAGYDNGLCEIDLATSQRRLLSPEGMGSTYATDVYLSPGGDSYYTTTDGYVYKTGVGRVSPQLDPNGIDSIDGTSSDDIWVLTDQGIVATLMPDGGFDRVDDITQTTYSMKVTTDGIFVGAFGGVAYKTRFTDGGFDFWPLPMTDPTNRVFNITGQAGAIHISGNAGATPSEAFFLSLIPRTQ
ncbi:MAG: hypothetical protein JNJ54_28985 [Myxococcaceae bacterium]|nr:hypothetical protein [Myxococcaceae bacterium]